MSAGKSALGLLGWLVACFAAASVGSQFLPGAWYAALTKPAWNPPSFVFAPVWTVLYTTMAVAAWLVWRRAGFAQGGAALAAFGVQLVLNAAWSYLFFGLHLPGVAFADIVALWIVILVVTAMFWRVDWRAGALMVPYLLWVGFASALNFALWRLNALPR